MSAHEKDQKPAPQVPTAPVREERSQDKAVEKIDFAKLDLRIEKVDERIAPSETNVFDK
jgi:hypothetical protein